MSDFLLDTRACGLTLAEMPPPTRFGLESQRQELFFIHSLSDARGLAVSVAVTVENTQEQKGTTLSHAASGAVSHRPDLPAGVRGRVPWLCSQAVASQGNGCGKAQSDVAWGPPKMTCAWGGGRAVAFGL